MKKLMTTMLFGTALALTACSGMNDKNADYGYETQAPYADERTVGSEEVVQPRQAEHVFEKRQMK